MCSETPVDVSPGYQPAYQPMTSITNATRFCAKAGNNAQTKQKNTTPRQKTTG
jgi:uncharacterized protein YgiB involved in biofilm formation